MMILRHPSKIKVRFAHEGMNFNREAQMLQNLHVLLDLEDIYDLSPPPIFVDVNTSKVN